MLTGATIRLFEDKEHNMVKRLLLILIIAIPSWYFSDMDSPSRFNADVLPITTFVCGITFCLWLISVFEHVDDQLKIK